jgi:Family of unknown function (DUF6318)
MRHSVVSAMAAALVAGASLAGCSDDSDDPPDSGLPAESEVTEPTSSPTDPEPTEPTGPQPPPLPDAATAPGKAGAKAFVAYYIRLLNYASHTGDTASLREYGLTCDRCLAFARLAKSTYEGGGWFKGGTWTPVRSSWFVLPSGSGFLVGLNLDVAASRQLARPGGEVQRYPAERIGRDFRVLQVGPAWRVVSMEEPL